MKSLTSRTAADIHVEFNDAVLDNPLLYLWDLDTLTIVDWTFIDGAFDGQPVLTTLSDYLQHISDLVEEAKQEPVH